MNKNIIILLVILAIILAFLFLKNTGGAMPTSKQSSSIDSDIQDVENSFDQEPAEFSNSDITF